MNYYALGNSGLKVSRLALGTMTFGTDWGWGADEKGAKEIFNAALEGGINFFDTANTYTEGVSEKWLGKFIKDSGVREQSVIATKYSLNEGKSANTGGNSRKSMITSVENSLRRLGTDYIDLFYLHVWDKVTPAEEVMRAFDDLVSAGKVRYVGLSDVPAWYAAQAQMIAQFRGYEPISAIQLQYSLVERHIEDEYVNLCSTLGPSLVSWGPLGGGLLSGKYKSSQSFKETKGRLSTVDVDSSAAFQKFSQKNLDIIKVLEEVSDELGQSMASVALNWVVNRPSVGSVLIGATKVSQILNNIKALDFTIPSELLEKLNNASQLQSHFPYSFFEDEVQQLLTGGASIGSKPENYSQSVFIEGLQKA